MSKTELTARDELYEIAELLREADEVEKEAKARKSEVRGPFLDLISEVVREEIPLATKTVTVEIDPDVAFDAREWQRREYPEWEVIAVQPEADGDGPATRVKITIRESDEFKKFEFVHNGFKFGRTVRMDGAGFDAEGFYNEVDGVLADPEDEVGHAMLNCVKTKTVTVYEFDEAKAVKVMADHPETVTVFQKYIIPGTPKVALLPIKAVKEHEVED